MNKIQEIHLTLSVAYGKDELSFQIDCGYLDLQFITEDPLLAFSFFKSCTNTLRADFTLPTKMHLLKINQVDLSQEGESIQRTVYQYRETI